MSHPAPRPVPTHIAGLLAYLTQPFEKANEDRALSYFRIAFGTAFTRQQDAHHADGYVPGSFVLELKGKANDWLAGLFQGLAYKNRELDFSQIVVAAKGFLAVWRVDDLPPKLREEIASETAAPNRVGAKYAKKYSPKKRELLKLAVWNGGDLSTPLVLAQRDVVVARIGNFERTLKEGRKVRQKITLKNFPALLKEMKQFFEPDQPIKAVRAFYSMIYAWTETSTVSVSQKALDQATLGGETITALVAGKRLQFKEFVENHFVVPDAQGCYDEYFARFDEALDAADKNFRVKNGIFFTDLDLARFVMWFVAQDIPRLGKNYLVIDPACGSGNLVTNWRSPLELRHKVVSEIEPELLFAVERRMVGDAWHNGKFTVVPKVSENRGLNFLDCSARDYLEQIKQGLKDKGLVPNKPLAFLCNPPYRSDDDQSADSIGYEVHKSIVDLTGTDASKERYCCFLAQMKLICETAEESGLPGDSLLLLFTKSAWLTTRKVFQDIRAHILGSFELVTGAMLRANEFFDVRGSWPLAFTVWRYKGRDANLNPNRSVPLTDLTWVEKRDLVRIPWAHPEEMRDHCTALLQDERARSIQIGFDRVSIQEWCGGTMCDFKRDRRAAERNARYAGGLPRDDRRQLNKKAYGEIGGRFLGFMDDLTPCRISRSVANRPWLNVDTRFMAVKRSRCFSGPPTHLGYCASDLEAAKKLFFWYALGRTFIEQPYPLWIDADAMWAPTIPESLERITFQMAFAIAYGENECIETCFPPNNPVDGLPELIAQNPMTPLNPSSFWCDTLLPYLSDCSSLNVRRLVSAVDQVFEIWKGLFTPVTEIPVAYQRPYFVGDGKLTKFAGLIQIRDYAVEHDVPSLRDALSKVQGLVRIVKGEFFEHVNARLDYFGKTTCRAHLAMSTKSRFDRALCRRLALAGLLVQHLHDDPHFGRTKLAKLVYLADMHEHLDLQSQYYREAAGPLDQRALYNERIGIEALAQKHEIFSRETEGSRMVRYKPAANMDQIPAFADAHLGDKVDSVLELARAFLPLNTDQCEIVATLYACWNDFLIRKHMPTDDEIVSEFLLNWHDRKKRFSRTRLKKAIDWMRDQEIIPHGSGEMTSTKHLIESEV